MNYNTEDAGVLSRVKFSDEHKDVFLNYIRNYYETDTFDILDIFFKQDFIKFLDIFSGHTISVPKRKDIYKIIFYINVYNYLKARKFAESAFENAATIFNKQKNSLKRIVIRVEKILNKPFDSHEDYFKPEPETDVTTVMEECDKDEIKEGMSEDEFNEKLREIQDDDSKIRGW